MSSLLSTLFQAGSGLAAHSSATQTASHNLQNAATPGYARQRAHLTAMIPGERLAGAYVGRGVVLNSVTQVRDRFLESQLPALAGAEAEARARAGALASVGALDPALPGGPSESLAKFYGALRGWAQNPSEPSHRIAVVGQAQSLSVAIRSSAEAIASAREGLDLQIEDNLAEVNRLASQLAALNPQIQAARAAGGEPNDLLDARQRVQDQLVALTGGYPVPSSRGDVSFSLRNGGVLVSVNEAATLSAVRDPSNGGHVAVWSTGVAGAPPSPLSGMGGAIGGALSARDQALRDAETGLDAFAHGLAASMNAVHQAGYAPDGSTGRALFETGAVQGAARRFSVNAAITAAPSLLAATRTFPPPAGDNTVVRELVDTESQGVIGGVTPSVSLGRIVSGFGAHASSADAALEHAGALADQLRGLRDAASGVSIDEELVALTRAQRAYEATAKVIQTADSLLDTLMKLK